MPQSGLTISVPSLVTSAAGGTGVAPTVTVEAEGGAVSNTDMVSQYLTGTVSKYSGMNTLSVELLERSDPNFYAELTTQLQNAYLTTIDTAVLTALLSAGTFGSATTADSDGIISYTAEAAKAVYANTGYFAQNYIGNPAQWQALMGAVDSTKRPIYNAIQPMKIGEIVEQLPASQLLVVAEFHGRVWYQIAVIQSVSSEQQFDHCANLLHSHPEHSPGDCERCLQLLATL